MKNNLPYTNVITSAPKIGEGFIKNIKPGVATYKFKEYDMRIAYARNDHLILSCSKEKILDELIPDADKLMDCGRVVSYLMDSPEFDELMTTHEWNSNPERRLRQINEENLGYKCVNLMVHEQNNNIKIKRMGQY